MPFQQLFDVHELPGEPKAHWFGMRDVNRLSGNKKFRVICNPNRSMKILHWRFLEWFRKRYISSSHSTCGEKGDSPIGNVEPHRGNQYFFVLDVRDAYHNVCGSKLSELLCCLDTQLTDQEMEVRQFLVRYFLESEKGGLLTGAPASLPLYNFYAGMLLDMPLGTLCRRHNLTLSRYLDDITISSSDGPIGKHKRSQICELIENAGFPIAHHKVKVQDLKENAITITGVGLRHDGQIFLPRGYLRRIRGMLNRALHHGDIPWAKVEGAMSVFFANTREGGLNQTEYKLLRQYRQARRILAP